MSLTPLQIVTAGNQKKIHAFETSDPIAMGMVYTENCRTMPPKKSVIHGRESKCMHAFIHASLVDDYNYVYDSADTAAFFKKGMESGLGSLMLTTDEVGPIGETINERGTFSFHGKDGSVLEEGK